MIGWMALAAGLLIIAPFAFWGVSTLRAIQHFFEAKTRRLNYELRRFQEDDLPESPLSSAMRAGQPEETYDD